MKNIQTVHQPELLDSETNNILDFSTTLRELRKHVDPNRLRQREAWRDRNGNVRTVDYIEWHTVADILDETAPNWAHSVKDIRVVGDYITVTVAISIDGITREGIGTGSARSEMGIKKAEHDALKRAAVKFGIARDLYKREFDAFERDETPTAEKADFPADPVAKTLSDMVTTKQLGMIRAIAREKDLDADSECESLLKCKISELSRKAASVLIDHLQTIVSPAIPIRRAG
ncbi:MAG: Rad52/Rad22 family DNA repair protein [Pyrinomonadaceae bacterium]